MPRSRVIAILLLFFSLILAALILTDLWPFLRGPAPETSEWYWPHLLRPVARWWPAIGSASMMLIFGFWWVGRKDERETIPLLFLVMLGLGLQFGLLYADRPNIGAELVDRTLSKASSGYLATAGETDDLADALRRFPELMPAFDNDHARTHPPGFIMAYWLTDHVLRRFPDPATLLARPATRWRCTDLWVLARPPATAASLFIWSWVPAFLAALTAPLAYRLAVRLGGSRPAARLSALLVATLPALLVFSPTPDQIFAFMSILSLLALVAGLRKRRYELVLLAGVTVSVMTFLSIGNIAWLALLGGFTVMWLIWPLPDDGQPPDWHQVRGLLFPALFAIGGVSIWFIYWLGWGVPPWEIIRVGLQQHYELVTSLRRYDWWFVYNLIDFLLFAGPAVVLGLVWRFGSAARDWRKRWGTEARLAILLVVVLLGVHLAGSTRGEVGRLWLLFMPTAAILAGGAWMKPTNDRLTALLILATQLIVAVSIGLGWRPFYAVILPVERPEIPAMKSPDMMVDATFLTPDGRTIRLIGFDAPEPGNLTGEVFDTTLYWQADGATLNAYTVFVHLIDESGQVVAQQDNWPVGGRWPSTCWDGGEVIVDRYQLQLPPAAMPGDLRLVAGLYDAGSNTRLRTPDGADSIRLLESLPE